MVQKTAEIVRVLPKTGMILHGQEGQQYEKEKKENLQEVPALWMSRTQKGCESKLISIWESNLL